MKIGDSPRISRNTEIGRPAARARAPESVTPPRPIQDTMSVMGIPEPELTPKVRQALVTLMEEVGRLRGDLERTRERRAHLERLADQDTLIPIANRRAFVRELSRVMSYVERYETPSGLVHFDVNSFKGINDTYGHAAGDEALHVVSNIFLQSIRESDVVGRLGGDEFGIILAHTDRAGAIEKAEALVESMRRAPFTWAGKRIQLEVAYGIYTFQAGEDPGRALAEADRAMYAHKQSMKAGG